MGRVVYIASWISVVGKCGHVEVYQCHDLVLLVQQLWGSGLCERSRRRRRHSADLTCVELRACCSCRPTDSLQQLMVLDWTCRTTACTGLTLQVVGYCATTIPAAQPQLESCVWVRIGCHAARSATVVVEAQTTIGGADNLVDRGRRVRLSVAAGARLGVCIAARVSHHASMALDRCRSPSRFPLH